MNNFNTINDMTHTYIIKQHMHFIDLNGNSKLRGGYPQFPHPKTLITSQQLCSMKQGCMLTPIAVVFLRKRRDTNVRTEPLLSSAPFSCRGLIPLASTLLRLGYTCSLKTKHIKPPPSTRSSVNHLAGISFAKSFKAASGSS